MHSVYKLPLRLRQLSSLSHCRPPLQTLSQTQFRRCVHQLRELPYKIEDGLGDFLSPEGLRLLAVDYQQGLLTRLNEQVKGTSMESQSVTDTVISAAVSKEHALAFNYASQALNNSFFLDCLAPPPSPPATNETILEKHDGSDDGMTIDLLENFRSQFGGLASMKSFFSAAALGMINSGWVWLVSDEMGTLQVVATFGAGTLLVRSRRHMRTAELPILGEPLISRYSGRLATDKQYSPRKYQPPSTTSPLSGVNAPPSLLNPSTPSRAYQGPSIFSNVSRTARPRTETISAVDKESGDILTPLLCVSVQEHAWVGTGYGVWGKEEYLKRFWSVVNWRRVVNAYKKAKQLS